jgi:ABC-type multidrug transport system fused ATPase/permease subunit
VCYLPQRAKLFNGTLTENLRYGNSWTSREWLAEAAEIADLGSVIAKLPQGWLQNLGPGGELLSGGERQRVAIARAILQCPKILVLDEATSEIDSISEQIVFERINAALPETTIIVISHRLSTLGWVDRILVLKDGEIIDEGTHNSLFGTNALYTELYTQGGPVKELDTSSGAVPAPGKLAVNGH